ncbi:MAG: Calx-beta domain-containing protein, partial [bacterium]
MNLCTPPDKQEVETVFARQSGATRFAAIAATYAALCLCFAATTMADTWTGTVVNGYSYQSSIRNKLTGKPALTNVQTIDDAGALALANAWTGKGDSISNRNWFSVFFTSDFPVSDMSIDSATIRVDYGATNTGNFVTYLSTNKSVTGWWTGSNTASALPFATNSAIIAYPVGADTNYLWDVTSTLNSSANITNCEVLVVNRTNSAAAVLYLGYFQLEVVYTVMGGPLVTNDIGASLILTNSARLNGRMIAGGPAPQTWFYWGTNDPGPVATGWSFTNDMGAQPYGSSFSNDIAGLIAGQTYYYRCRATNIHGTNWDVNPAVFTTLQTRAEFSVTASNGLESATSPVFLPVRLACTSAVPVSISYSVIGGTATAADFSLTNNTLVIPAGSIAGNIGIIITNDTIYESNETIVVAITGLTGASPGINTQCTYTIMNDDSPPLISFANQPYRPLESSTNAVISVALSQVAGMPVSVDYGTWADTASNILDYTNVSGTLSWPIGDQSTKTILVPLVN